MMNHLLDQRADIWRGNQPPTAAPPGVATGWPELDALLAGGGWPCGAVTEILSTGPGAGGLELLMPSLVRLGREGRWITFVAPPLLPYAPALATWGVALERLLVVKPGTAAGGLWAVEQALRSGACSAVLAWPAAIEPTALRRLQLAAEAGAALAIVFRAPEVAAESSPAALRLRVQPAADGWLVEVLKRRGGWRTGPVRLRSRTVGLQPLPDGPLTGAG
jgi:protein ImuA